MPAAAIASLVVPITAPVNKSAATAFLMKFAPDNTTSDPATIAPSTPIVSNGKVGMICGLTIVVSTTVVDDEAMIIIRNKTATWQSAVDMKTAIISNDRETAGIKVLIRSWLIGQIQIHHPKSIYTITETEE